jgi:hypothetical protein
MRAISRLALIVLLAFGSAAPVTGSVRLDGVRQVAVYVDHTRAVLLGLYRRLATAGTLAARGDFRSSVEKLAMKHHRVYHQVLVSQAADINAGRSSRFTLEEFELVGHHLTTLTADLAEAQAVAKLLDAFSNRIEAEQERLVHVAQNPFLDQAAQRDAVDQLINTAVRLVKTLPDLDGKGIDANRDVFASTVHQMENRREQARRYGKVAGGFSTVLLVLVMVAVVTSRKLIPVDVALTRTGKGIGFGLVGTVACVMVQAALHVDISAEDELRGALTYLGYLCAAGVMIFVVAPMLFDALRRRAPQSCPDGPLT